MAVRQQKKQSRPPEPTVTKLRQFVVRLEQPGMYDRLLRKSLQRSDEEGRRVAMTEVVREALDAHLD